MSLICFIFRVVLFCNRNIKLDELGWKNVLYLVLNALVKLTYHPGGIVTAAEVV